MVTKRQLGIFFTLCAVILLASIFAIEWFGAGNFEGIGPLQRMAIIATLGILGLGISLIPFGNRPA